MAPGWKRLVCRQFIGKSKRKEGGIIEIGEKRGGAFDILKAHL